MRARGKKGLKPEPVVNPEDLKKMLAERNRVVVMPAETPASAALAVRPVDDSAGIARVLNALASVALPSSPVRQEPRLRLFLTLKEAAEYSGLSMALLQRMCANCDILSVKDNGWKIQRRALDELAADDFGSVRFLGKAKETA